MGILHLVRTQAACIYLFHFHKLILCGFNQIFLNHKRVYFNHNQSISTTNNFNQPFAINQFSHQSQPINIVHGLWTRGVYIYIYIAIHFYFNTYIYILKEIEEWETLTKSYPIPRLFLYRNFRQPRLLSLRCPYSLHM